MLIGFVQKILQTSESPFFFVHGSTGVDPAPPAENLAVLKLSFEDGVVEEEEFAPAVHFSVSHFSLVAGPDAGFERIVGGEEESPAIGLVLGPLSMVL